MRIKLICSALLLLLGNGALFGDSFSLVSVAPRSFAPREYEPQYSMVKFTITNPNYSEINATIMDLSGMEVRSNLTRETETILVWDGRDSNGKILPAGVYIYQLEADGKAVNGSVVVIQ